jgi:hypothetical protein
VTPANKELFGTNKLKRIMRKFRINEISAVDRPAQEDATMAIIKRNSVVGPSVAVKRALSLDATATEADCVRAVQQMDVARKELAAARSAEAVAKAARERLEQEAQDRTFLKASAAQAEAQRRRELDVAAKAELAKLRASDVGRASLEPKSTEIVSVTDATAASTVRTAYEQIKEIAREIRRASGKLSEAQAFEIAYNQNPRLAELERRERFLADARYIDPP